MQLVKANDLTEVTVTRTTLVVIGDNTTGEYTQCTVGDILRLRATEVILVEDVDTAIIEMTTERKNIFGEVLNIQVELLNEDAVYRVTNVEIIPDVVPNTTQYTINFGALSTARIKIS